jgi:hypothetical protein
MFLDTITNTGLGTEPTRFWRVNKPFARRAADGSGFATERQC